MLEQAETDADRIAEDLIYLVKSGFFNTEEQQAEASEHARKSVRDGLRSRRVDHRMCVWSETGNDKLERGRALVLALNDLHARLTNIVDKRALSQWSSERLSQSLNTSQDPSSQETG